MLDRNGDEHRLTVVGRGHANNERNKQTRHRQSAARALRNLRARIAVSYCIDACSRGVLRSIEMGLQ